MVVELKQISEISGYLFEIHYPDTDLESFRIIPSSSEIYFACQSNKLKYKFDDATIHRISVKY